MTCLVVLAGGMGLRLWPLSNPELPKPFMRLFSDRSLFQETILRGKDAIPNAQILVVANVKHRRIVESQILEIGCAATILLEPEARDTAPAIAGAANHLIEQGSGATPMLVLPADHFLVGMKEFAATVELAIGQCVANELVAIGVSPRGPDPRFGYVLPGEQLDTRGDVFRVDRFTEKPAPDDAQKLIDKGALWNAGVFAGRAAVFASEIAATLPNIGENATSIADGMTGESPVFLLDESFRACPKISIDHGVMEKSNRILMVRTDLDFRDVGTWQGIVSVSGKDSDGNTTIGNVGTNATRNSYIRNDGGGRVLALGVDGLVVVSTGTDVLVGAHDQVDNIKEMLIPEDSHPSEHDPDSEYRPWGRFERIHTDPEFIVKRLLIDPGERISLQKHSNRSEHWVVVRGTAKIQIGESTNILCAGQSTYVPQGELHRVENVGEKVVEIIEVQLGEHISEDDIERFDDSYGRK
jgi:mannose-1-phosphate guanylyltransferase/mannose-6-phosphate isomerase